MKIKMIFCSIVLLGLVLVIGLPNNYPIPLDYSKLQAESIIASSDTPDITPIDTVWSMIEQVNQARVMTDLRKLTGAEKVCLDHGCYTIYDRATGSTGLQCAKDYVEEELIKVGYTVVRQNWSADQNLIVHKVGFLNQNEVIYFLAHLDGVPNIPAADDNASGVASLLELARILSSRAFRNTIILIFSTGEEQGVRGVQSYVDSLTQQELNSIKYVINVDMIGYDANNDKVMELYNGSQPEDFVQILSGIISAYQINLVPQIYPDCN